MIGKVDGTGSVSATGVSVDARDRDTANISLVQAPPMGPVPSDDLETALSILMIENLREQRSMGDAERAEAMRSQEEAFGRKIEKMRELAEDTFAQGLGDGLFQIASAGMQAGAAKVGYDGAHAEIEKELAEPKALKTRWAENAALLSRNSRLLDAGAKGVSGAGAIATAATRAAIERDRTHIAQIEHDIDRAKSTVDGCSSTVKRAEDDIRETMAFVKQYLAAKAQTAQAAIIRG